jgi:hypothetical protein
MAPSGSKEALPSSNKLSRGSTRIVSLPARAIGGLLVAAHPSQEYSFMHEERSTGKNIRAVTFPISRFINHYLVMNLFKGERNSSSLKIDHFRYIKRSKLPLCAIV